MATTITHRADQLAMLARLGKELFLRVLGSQDGVCLALGLITGSHEKAYSEALRARNVGFAKSRESRRFRFISH